MEISFEYSAIINQDWRPKTYKELFIQWQAKVIYDWNHTTSLKMVHLDSTKYSFFDLHPYLKEKEQEDKTKIKLPNKPLLRDKLDK